MAHVLPKKRGEDGNGGLLARLWSLVFFRYFTPYMRRARDEGQAAVRAERLPDLWEADNLHYWSQRFMTAAHRQWTRRGGPSRFALLETVMRVFWKHILAIYCIRILDLFLEFAAVDVIAAFTRWKEMDPSDVSAGGWSTGLLHGGTLVVLQLVSIIMTLQCNFWSDRVTMRIQGCLLTCLFRRCVLPIRRGAPAEGTNQDTEAVQATTRASVFNLLLVDVPGVPRIFHYVMKLSLIPLRVWMAYVTLRTHVESAALRGCAAMVLILLPIVGIEIYNGFLRHDLLHYRDQRVGRCHEALSVIRTLRMLGLEEAAEATVQNVRAPELRCRALRMYLHSITWALSQTLRPTTRLVIIASHVLEGLQQGKPVVFTASVIVPVFFVVSRCIAPLADVSYSAHTTVESWVSIMRYQHHVFGSSGLAARLAALPSADLTRRAPSTGPFWSGPRFSYKPGDVSDAREVESLLQHPRESQLLIPAFAIEIRDAVFGWEAIEPPAPRGEELPLRRPGYHVRIPSLEVRCGQCAIMFGGAGSGKTASILSMLGEIPLVSGTCRVETAPRFGTHPSRDTGRLPSLGATTRSPGRHATTQKRGVVGYSPQVPWLPEGSACDVILFGRPLDKTRYARVIDACALETDFRSWDEGDQRLILENGTNLSGGQKTRISLARALYDYPVPLSEVPTLDYRHVGMDGIQGTRAFFLDDAVSTSDPRVGFAIFKSLFGPSGLLKCAATVLVIDEPSFRFYVNQMRETESHLGVDFLLFAIDNGAMQRQAERIATTLPAPAEGAPPHGVAGPPGVPSRRTSERAAAAAVAEPVEGPTAEEQAYSGAVDAATYGWLFRKCNLILVLLTFLLVFHYQFTEKALRFWLASWSAGMTGVPQNITQDVIAEQPRTALNLQTTLPPLVAEDSDNALLQLDALIDQQPKVRPSMTPEDALLATTHRVKRRVLEPTALVEAAEDVTTTTTTTTTSSLVRTVTPIGQPAPAEEAVGQEAKCETLDCPGTSREFKVFVALSLSLIVGQFAMVIIETGAGLKAARRIHTLLLSVIVHAPFWVYDCIPLGVLVNRFSADIHSVDSAPLYPISKFWSSTISAMLTGIALMILTSPSILILPIVCAYVYFGVYSLYRPASREIERSSLMAFSPLCGNMSETESGHVVIRSMGGEVYYSERNLACTNALMKTYFMKCGIKNWTDMRLRFLAFPFGLLNTIVPVLVAFVGPKDGVLRAILQPLKFTRAPAFTSFALSFALDVPWVIGSVVHLLAEVEGRMCSVQRVKELIDLKDSPDVQQKRQEETVVSLLDMPTTRTGISMIDLEVAYYKPVPPAHAANHFARQTLTPALRGITVTAAAGEHIGVVGRTGAGKSTLLTALMGVVTPSRGHISIDGVPLGQIRRDVLAEMIGVLPQTPVVLRGWTVRQFLDSEGTYASKDLLHAVERVGLLAVVGQLPKGLDTIIAKEGYGSEEGGIGDKGRATAAEDDTSPSTANCLSESQLRILSLARLLLHAGRYRLVLVDEPPVQQTVVAAGGGEESAVFAQISQYLRDWFPKATVITVAHHAVSLKNCDTVWILSQGQLVAQVPRTAFEDQEGLMHLIQEGEDENNERT